MSKLNHSYLVYMGWQAIPINRNTNYFRLFVLFSSLSFSQYTQTTSTVIEHQRFEMVPNILR